MKAKITKSNFVVKTKGALGAFLETLSDGEHALLSHSKFRDDYLEYAKDTLLNSEYPLGVAAWIAQHELLHSLHLVGNLTNGEPFNAVVDVLVDHAESGKMVYLLALEAILDEVHERQEIRRIEREDGRQRMRKKREPWYARVAKKKRARAKKKDNQVVYDYSAADPIWQDEVCSKEKEIDDDGIEL